MEQIKIIVSDSKLKRYDVMDRIRDAFQTDISLRTLFEEPTVEESVAIVYTSRE